ncbi:Tad domain-containing protein [Intrasporangium chromatireducens]|uniref:Tad domain-containing protein n=1 Tax=Intrasporangium chromatireducens TaxID=1386088 RepID=UPI00138DF75B|nr:Tad domain-containing protein [Intrasporangium chromatireducens]
MVTAIFTAFIVIAALAVSVDVGRITSERSQLQNGADAAAAALASFCADGSVRCSADPSVNKLQELAGRNAQDGSADLSGGSYGGGSWDPACFHGTLDVPLPGVNCPAGEYVDISNCPPAPDWLTADFPYVETRPHTLEKDSTTILPNIFGKALSGASTGDTYRTCARAAWGSPKSYSSTVPVTFSMCEWQEFMATTGNVYGDKPVGRPGYGGADQPPWPSANYDQVIYLANSDKSAPCTKDGRDGPGGFGDVQAPGCQATVSTGGWLVGDNGENIASDCKTVLANLRGTVVSIPVFDCLYKLNTTYNGPLPGNDVCDGSGSGGTYNYHVAGWARFYISGYSFPGVRSPSYIAATNTSPQGYPCTNSESCISGWFVKGELEADAILPPDGSSDYGSYAIVPAG